ncbi:uncharacterized membrane protein YgaE (UPF0421/DUF939 family) [Actinoalloteichus hoggarensis]|uniref:Uncharacterized protein n=1 Tax=Actinoalloteichus hoggarensis TaxID=1470176 RepID=A0A221W6I5_9PSEU|nr:FUSC family protein [Actinoalloteichus hoggarensis]ASO21508.1 hypothetical protein AHOG_19430 [Actinoalloteichus hoggarensis]MBB5922097.1 uncharacterized membrane protein YgaE (UPF0421/DUF939 family) [Actinoalloteichus hoggarensis]
MRRREVGVNRLWDGARAAGRWSSRAIHERGAERSALTQAAKAALAAVLAWLIAAEILELPQPFLAPYTAVFLVETTVYRSVWSAAQQTGAVLGGILLAMAVDTVIPVQAAAIGVAVLVGLILGRWRGFGTSGVWVAVTALLLLGYGSADDMLLLADRLLEVLIGAVLGVTINALIVPPVYMKDPAAAVGRVVEELTGLLRDIATTLRAEGLPDHAQEWLERIRSLETTIRRAEEATGWARESIRFNPRRRRHAVAADRWRLLLVRLRSAWPHVGQLAESVHTTSYERQPFRYPDMTARTMLADLVDATADLVDARSESVDRPVELRRITERGQAAADRLRGLCEPDGPDGPSPRIGLASLLLPAMKAFDQVAD